MRATIDFVEAIARATEDSLKWFHQGLRSRAEFEHTPGFMDWTYGYVRKSDERWQIRVYLHDVPMLPNGLCGNLLISVQVLDDALAVRVIESNRRTLMEKKYPLGITPSSIAFNILEAWSIALIGALAPYYK